MLIAGFSRIDEIGFFVIIFGPIIALGVILFMLNWDARKSLKTRWKLVLIGSIWIPIIIFVLLSIIGLIYEAIKYS